MLPSLIEGHKMVVKVIPANKEFYAPQIREIFWEYL